MAEEDGVSVDEVCDDLIVELATLEEGDGTALAQFNQVWFREAIRAAAAAI